MAFPGALSNDDLMKKLNERLSPFGYGSNSLVATSLCCDEVNRPLEKSLAKSYDEPFVMGGLAGFPFGGVTSFGALLSQRRSQRRPKQKRDLYSTECIRESQRNLGAKRLEGTSRKANTPRPPPP